MKLLLPVMIPILAGILVLASKEIRKNRKLVTGLSAAVLVVEAALIFTAILSGGSLCCAG